MTHLHTLEDLQWLTEVHNVPTDGIVVASIHGNEDAPDKVETYTVDHYQATPTVYVSGDDGDLHKQEENES